MAGITDLSILLSSLEPTLRDEEFVFAIAAPERVAEYLLLKPIGLFFENEGLTLILSKKDADEALLQSSGPFRCITAMVHSSLKAVGLTAAISAALAEVGISANVVAAYHHDHIFVPAKDAHRALAALRMLSQA